MKEYDYVKLTAEKEEYSRFGIQEGLAQEVEFEIDDSKIALNPDNN